MKIFLFIFFLYIQAISVGQPNYWQQKVDFFITVSLNDKEHTLDGFEKMEYQNNSPDTLTFIWIHLWQNAFKNDKTAFSEQLLENGRTDFYFSNNEQRGYINRLDFRINNTALKTEDHPQYIDIIKIILPEPLLPHQKVTITTPFHVKLPDNFSRGGHNGQSYQITQWYPKPAVYDRKGWHPMPYLDQGEFYSEFGNYEVQITLPENYVVAATGVLQNQDEKEWLKTRKNFTLSLKKVKLKNKKSKLVEEEIPSSGKIKTLTFKQNDVHDFAWFADKRFVVEQDTFSIEPSKIISASVFYLPTNKVNWKNSIEVIKKTIRTRSTWIGNYPYETISVVEAKMGFSGGMEYPTITSISENLTATELESTIEHEVGHNWFYGILANNERTHPWMDEGMNTFYDLRFKKMHSTKKDLTEHLAQLFLNVEYYNKLQQPIETPSENFTELNYSLTAYFQTANWLQSIENSIGREKFDSIMKKYFEDWKFKHPYPEDFYYYFKNLNNSKVDALFQQKNSIAHFNQKPLLKNQFVNPFQLSKNISLLNKSKSATIISPIVGYNHYDKLMLGGFITNYLPPVTRFQYALAPMYSFNTKKFSGIGRIAYSWFPQKTFYKIEAALTGATFSSYAFKPEKGDEVFLRFNKISPSLRFTLKEKRLRSTQRKFVELRSYFFKEDQLRFRNDSIITPGTPPDTSVINVPFSVSTNRYLNQLKFVVENTRVLYPYRAELQIEQAKDFVRLAFTGNYFFNYAKGGGLDFRFFAGKFFYLGAKTITKQFETDAYHLNMTGPKGYEDYTYSNYFIGRNEFEKLSSQQIMIRDGAFKVRTDLLNSKIGKTDDWLMATNFTTTIPDGLNPLSVLPIKIPLRIFVDIGTYAEAWKKDAPTGKILYDAGLQLTVAKIINVYIPILYSKVYRDYFKSTIPENRFLKNISFSIDIQNIKPKMFSKLLPF